MERLADKTVDELKKIREDYIKSTLVTLTNLSDIKVS